MSVPKLRFKEFDGDWDFKKIGDISDCIVPGRNKPKVFNGTIPWVTTPDLKDNIYVSDTLSDNYISENEAKTVGSKIVPKNSVVMSCVGDLGLFAINTKPIVINQQLHAFLLDSQKLNSLFVLNALSKNQNFIEKVATKTALPYLNKDNCNSIPLFITTLKEQTKIASFLSQVDEKISQLNQKHSLLSQYKQGMMQKLFSQQIRFKADDGSEFGEWESLKVFDLAKDKSLNNGVFNDQNKVGKGYKLINVLDMYINRDIDEKRLSLLDLDKKEFEKNKVYYGDIFFTRSSLVKEGIAFSNVYLGNSDDITYDGHLIKLSPDLDRVSPKFLNYCLKISHVRKQLIQGGKTATMTTIGQQEVGNTLVNIPCLEEQTKIANFLSAIDQKIEVVAQQIEQAKTWKKGLLQQMFV